MRGEEETEIMGVDTKGIMAGLVSPHEIAAMLRDFAEGGEVLVRENGRRSYDTFTTTSAWVTYTEPGGKVRQMHVFSYEGENPDHAERTGIGSPHTQIGLASSDTARAAVLHVLDRTGGAFLSNDADGEWVPVAATRERTPEEIDEVRSALVARAMLRAAEETAFALNVGTDEIEGLRGLLEDVRAKADPAPAPAPAP